MQTTTDMRLPTIAPHPTIWARLWPVSGATGEIAALDGLRGIAVLLTVAVHLPLAVFEDPTTPATVKTALGNSRSVWDFGATGVHLFFILSGFLLFMPYARTMLGLQPLPDTRKFYLRRALRIVPAYWFSLLLLVLLVAPTLLDGSHWDNVILHLLLIHNWDAAIRVSINPPFWTMAVESHFYLVLPLFAFGLVALARRGKRLLIGGVFVGFVALSIGYGVLLVLLEHRAPALANHLPILDVFGYMAVFGCGMACSLLYVAIGAGKLALNPLFARRLFRSVGIGGVLVLALYIGIAWRGTPVGDESRPIYWLAGNLLLAAGYGSILLGVLLGWRSWARVLASPALRFLGIISYSLYIWNWPIIDHISVPFAVHFGATPVAFVGGSLLALVVTIPVAFLVYTCVERPFTTLRRKAH